MNSRWYLQNDGPVAELLPKYNEWGVPRLASL